MRPWLLLPPQWAHDLGPWALPIFAQLYGQKTPTWQPFSWRGLRFENRFGLAGGVDKSGESLRAWQQLGAGFLEVGTVTPLPQTANPGKILARDIPRQAVWNKMGFPNKGVARLKKELQKFAVQKNVPLFVNIGKNRQTAHERAHEDYLSCLSSPNTSDLRRLLQPENLQTFLRPILQWKKTHSRPIPFFLKLSPDMPEDSFDSALETSLSLDIDGWILTNTTLARAPGLTFPQEGGVSGEPLRESSFQCLQRAHEYLRNKKQGRLLISTGGIHSAAEAQRRFASGADLMQAYSALIFAGPRFFQQTLAELQRFTTQAEIAPN
jgi:dihydroorotate dehydrogenase